MNPRTRGALALLKLGHTQPVLAQKLDVSNGIISLWISGERKPGLANRQLMFEKFQIPIEAWDQVVTLPPVGKPKAVPPAWGSAAVAGREEELEEMVATLVTRARTDTSITTLEQAKVLSLCANIKSQLARIRGENVKEARLLKQRAWARWKDRVIRAVAPIPGALEAIEAEFARGDIPDEEDEAKSA